MILNESINTSHSYERLSIPNKIDQTLEEVKSEIKLFLNKGDSIENTIEKIEYILSKIYFSKTYRKKEFQYIKENRGKFSEEDIEAFFDKYSNQVISGEDWQKLIHSTGLCDWSMGKSGDNIEDRISIIKTISYFSIDATLRTGIHTGLFIQNIGKYFPDVKDEIFEDFTTDESLSGGLALTELSSGTNLFANFESKYVDNNDGTCTINGIKHLQGLSDEATHWIFLAENKDKKGEFKLFIIDTRKDDQNVVMQSERIMSELKSITYGVNKFNAIVDDKYSAGLGGRRLEDFQSMLFESRMQFPAMMNGALERIYDESKMKSELRNIGLNMDKNESVKSKLVEMKNYSNISNIINTYLIYKNIKLGKDNFKNEDLSIIAKTISTEYMQKSGNIGIELAGGLGFEQKNIIRQMISSAWPFTRFEGVNEMLYSKIVRNKRKNIVDNKIEKLIKEKIGLDIQYYSKTNNRGEIKSDIYNLKINNSQKGYILVRISILEMIYEMGLENENIEEIKFLLNEIIKEGIEADNFSPKGNLDEKNNPIDFIKAYHSKLK